MTTVLGIETSCDETSAAIIGRADAQRQPPLSVRLTAMADEHHADLPRFVVDLVNDAVVADAKSPIRV
jgi:tRNA A37 threonylcarbamoyltransferase TsaD